MTTEHKVYILNKYEQLASQGLRIIGLAHKFVPASSIEGMTREEAERDFTFLALAGISDPPRPETLGAVRACKNAGIVVHMWVSSFRSCT
jgi:magnesium-transporting ATPase (P-type)